MSKDTTTTSTSREKFNSLFLISRKCAALCGADLFNPNYKLNWMTWFVIISTNTFFVLSGYTVYVAVYIEEDYTAMLKSLCMVGSGIQGMSKLFSGIKNKLVYREVFEEVDTVYMVYEKKHTQYQMALNDTTSINLKFVKFIAALYIGGTIILLCVPLFFLIKFNEKILLMQFLIPGIDHTTLVGHLILSTAHFVCIFMGSFGIFAGDMFFFLFILQVPLYKNILRIKFEDLNEKIPVDEDEYNDEILPALQDIIKWHQKYSAFTQRLSDVFYAVIFFHVLTTSLSVALTVFIVSMGAWFAGYGYMTYSFFMLCIYCGLGTVTELSNDDVCNSVYNSCIWYRLSLPQRKMLIFMLIKAQKPTLLTVGDVMPLSVTTALSLTKTIYSFLMMMLNFSKN